MGKNNNTQIRFDRISYDVKSLKEDPETGYLVGDAYVTRTGVLTYYNRDGTIRKEYRSPEEVFSKESLDSMKLVYLTNEHPDEMLNADNSKFHAVGMIGENIRKAPDNIRVLANIKVTDSDTIKDIKSRKRVDISMGYRQIPKYEKGRADSQEYDLIQTKIRYNHAAATIKGRAGKEVGLVLDSYRTDSGIEAEVMWNKEDYEFNIDSNNNDDSNNGDLKMGKELVTVTYDSVGYEVPPQIAVAMDSMKKDLKKITTLESEKKELKKNLDSIKAERDQLKKDVEAVEKRVDSDEFKKAVTEKTVLVQDASLFFKKDELEKLDLLSMDNDEIITKALESYDSEFDYSAESSDYRKAAFRLAKKTINKDSNDKTNDKKKLFNKRRDEDNGNNDSTDLKGEELYRANALKNYDTANDKVVIH